MSLTPTPAGAMFPFAVTPVSFSDPSVELTADDHGMPVAAEFTGWD